LAAGNMTRRKKISFVLIGLICGLSLPIAAVVYLHGLIQRSKTEHALLSIGQVILLYTNENSGAYPPDFGTLAKAEDLPALLFVYPDPAPTTLTPDQTVAWVNQNSRFAYVGAGLTQQSDPSHRDPSRLVAYEKGDAGPLLLLFDDGHVERDPLEKAQRIIRDGHSSN
jgi:hypothetical protein